MSICALVKLRRTQITRKYRAHITLCAAFPKDLMPNAKGTHLAKTDIDREGSAVAGPRVSVTHAEYIYFPGRSCLVRD